MVGTFRVSDRLDHGKSSERTARRRRYGAMVCVFSGAITAALSLLLRLLCQPLFLFNSPNDDANGVDQAFILSGHHLGISGIQALSKDPGGAYFLIAAHAVGVPPLIFEQLVFLVGVVCIALGWFALSHSRWQATVVMVILALNPINYEVQVQRIYRDGFILALSTLIIGLSFILAALINPRSAPQRESVHRGPFHRNRRLIRILAGFMVVVLIGLLMGWQAVTKATWPWVIPAMVAPLVYPLSRRYRQVDAKRRLRVLGVALACAVLIVSMIAFVTMRAKSINQAHYGVAQLEVVFSGSVASAVDQWVRIDGGSTVLWEPITPAMMETAFAVSPTARLLRSYLMSPTDPEKSMNCTRASSDFNLMVNGTAYCKGVSGGWILWDLVAAPVSLGLVHTPAQLETFYSSVATEIATACRRSRITCSSSPVLATSLPPLARIDTVALVRQSLSGLWRMATNTQATFVAASYEKLTLMQYREWRAIVAGLPNWEHLRQPSHAVGAMRGSPVLARYYVHAYSWLNMLLVIPCLVGLAYVPGTRRRKTFDEVLLASSISRWMALSALIGVTFLAVFQVSVFEAMKSLYWADFVTPLELTLVLGSFSVLLLLQRAGRSRDSSTSTPATLSTQGTGAL